MRKYDEYVWVYKYRPKTIKDIILPEKTRQIIKGYLKSGDLQNLLLYTNKPGTGKTSLAEIIINELKADSKFINGSMDGGIDALRNEVKQFASTVSVFSDYNKKIVVIDEADYVSDKFGNAMRGFIEEFNKSCIFIFTCNNIQKIIEPIKSRCTPINMLYITKDEKKQAKIKMYKKIIKILKNEKIEYNDETIVDFINELFPDMRAMLNILQMESKTGKIDNHIVEKLDSVIIQNIFELIKNKSFQKFRDYVNENVDIINNIDVYSRLYNNIDLYIHKNSIPEFILLLNDREYKEKAGINNMINFLCFGVECMKNITFN